MCLSPILKKNPNYSYRGEVLINHRKYETANPLQERIAKTARGFCHDADNSYLYIPCGHCAECVAAKQNAIVQRASVESVYNHLFFCTLTYDNKHIPKLVVRVPKKSTHETEENAPELFGVNSSETLVCPTTDFEECEFVDRSYDESEIERRLADAGFDVGLDDVTGVQDDPLAPDASDEYDEVEFTYADIHHVQLLMKNLRDNLEIDGRSWKYICVSELGKTNGRPHFHILFFVEKLPQDMNADGTVNRSQMYNLEKKLYQAVFKYWAINVGTRKNPVYEKLFTYRKRFYGNKCYTNFDLHYVDPKLSPSGTSNVTFYVTKYLMKGSKKEEHRQQFLHLNLSETQYQAVWSAIKCRCTISKGFGLDSRMYTQVVSIPMYIGPSSCDYAAYLKSLLAFDDLPADDANDHSKDFVYKTVKKRIMVPNFEAVGKIRDQLIRDAGKAPYPVFISPDGKHVPLAHYYKTKGYIYTLMDEYTIWFNWNPDNTIPSHQGIDIALSLVIMG